MATRSQTCCWAGQNRADGSPSPGRTHRTTCPPSRRTTCVLTYTEGLHIGYRHFDRAGREPRYPFGHGLGYTRWEYVAAEVAAAATRGEAGDVIVRVRLRNAGATDGCETIQVYASRPDSAVERPVRWLAGFAKVEALAGAEVTADIAIPLRCLAHWDTAAGRWTVEPGGYQLSVGRSSRDLPLSVAVPIGPAQLLQLHDHGLRRAL